MATQSLSRTLLSKPSKSISVIFSRCFSNSSSCTSKTPASLSTFALFNRARPLASVLSSGVRGWTATRDFSTRSTKSSLNDPNPNWSNRPPKETILLEGCDFEHWLIVMEKPEGDPTRDEIIDSYIKTLASVVGSEEEARMKIYSVSTRCYFAFGALVSEELSYKIKELPKVRWVLPDSYLDVRNKDYGGEPFIDGKAVPYDPKYHEEWIRNNARANERNRRNDRPRNFDRSRNFDRRRENNSAPQDFNRPPMPNQGMQNAGPNMGAPPSNMGAPPNNMGAPPNNMIAPPSNMGAPPNNMGAPPNNMGAPSPNYTNQPPPNYNSQPPPNYGGPPPPNYNRPPPPNYSGPPPPPNYNRPPPPNYSGGPPPPNYNGPPPPNYSGQPSPNFAPPPNMGGPPPNMGVGQPNYNQNSGSMPYQGQGGAQNPQFQNSYNPMSGGNPERS